MFTYRVFFRRFRLSVIRRPAFQQRYNIFPSLWLIHRKKKSHLERRLFLTTSSAQLPSSLLLVRLVFKGYLNIKKNHIKYILLLWNAHAHKNTSSSHCIVLNHYYCCIYIYIYINPNQYHLQQYHHYTPSSSPPSPTSMGWTSNEDIEVQLRDINQVVTKAFFDDWKKP